MCVRTGLYFGKEGVAIKKWECNPSASLSPHRLWIASRCFHPAPGISSHCQRVPSREMLVPDLGCEASAMWRLSMEAAGKLRGSIVSAADGVVRDTVFELGPE